MSNPAFEAPGLEYLGARLPQYEFLEFIAQGGMGAVYKARQISLDREVAIKVLPHELGEDEEFRESFTKEARAMAKLNHPNLIGVYDSGCVDGMPYIVMEYIEGSSLHDSCWGQIVDPEQAVMITKAICDGLGNAHEHGIIHRDIKPANILLNLKAVPKIGDFGLAHASDSDEAGLVMGTPGYTAPEVFLDPNQAGPLADIYSVGIILHQLLTGTDPTLREGPPSEATGRIRLDAIWRKATQPQPGARYGSVGEMALDLQKWLDNKSGAMVTGVPARQGGALTVPFNPRNRSIASAPMMPVNQGSGGMGMLMKVAALGVLLAAAWFAYGLRQDDKIKNNELANNEEAPPESPAIPGGHPPRATVKRDPVPAPAPVADPAIPKPVIPDPVISDPVASHSDPESNPDPAPVPDPVTPEPVVPDQMATVDPRPGIPPGNPELRQRAAALIAEEQTKRNNLLLKNVQPLQAILREQASRAYGDHARFLKDFADACSNGLVADLDDADKLSEKVSLVYQKCLSEQESILKQYELAVTRIRDFYVPMLEKAVEESSDDTVKEQLLAQVERALDVNNWVALLAPGQTLIAASITVVEGEVAPAPIGGGGGHGFVGTWDVVSDNVTKWETTADGTITVVGPGWQGQWKILDDGTLQITFGGKPPYSLERDGAGWSGTTGYKRPIRVTPAGGVQNTRPEFPVGGRGKGFAGRWEVTSDNFTIYHCKTDGTFVVEGRGWKGTWKEQDDGAVMVQMQGKKPHFIKQVADGVWEAPYGRDNVIRFVSVDSKESITSRKAGVASGERHARDFVGKWDAHTNISMRWDADQNGEITIYDEDGSKKNWSGLWKAMSDGSIWVQIATKTPHEFVRSGSGWESRTKVDIKLTPGRW